ncbi:SUMF1/EgtB/PvdO family nonheme iron enzyme [Marinicaulis aureus]|uniref:SUMF1/EgtB/PvdO family nonheme iron enzyme n=1 Tax=Hyphococcus aureus TaxID=2666033 RepID=A0ABW1KUG7_9PROT
MPMSPISILHAPRDEALGAKIAAALAHAGHAATRVSADQCDPGPQAGGNGDSAAIVVWTHAAAKLAKLHRQAEEAMDRGALIPVAVGGALPPGGFENLPPVDLSGWTGAPDDPRWRFVLEEIQLTTQRMGLSDADVWSAPDLEPHNDEPGLIGDQELWTPGAEMLATDYSAANAPSEPTEPVTARPALLHRPKPKRRFSAKEVAFGATAGLVLMTVATAVLAPVILPAPELAAQPQLAARSAEIASRPAENVIPDPSVETPSSLASLTVKPEDNPSTEIIIPPAPESADDMIGAQANSEEPVQLALTVTPASAETDMAASGAADDDAIQTLIAAVAAETPQEKSSAGDIFRDCANCPDMAALPAGVFQMGARPGEVGAKPAESPVRDITFRNGFALSSREVTYEEWDTCVADGGCAYKAPDHGWGRDQRPVVSVSYEDALSYVAWLSKKTGQPYRLPTEAEWEYAARAGSSAPFATGSTVRAGQANYNGQYPYSGEKETYRGRTVPVASFAPNAFGLYDMHGNAWEWTADCWTETHAGAPSDGSAVATGDCTKHVLKGGAWNTGGWRLRSAHRIGKPAGAREFDNGFRVARDLG